MDTVDHIVGRDVEQTELATLAHDGQLVTVTGTGGVGKTTLVAGLARDRRDAGPVATADLTRVEEPAAVRAVVAGALGQARFDDVGVDTVPGAMLLVVDNCEHVLDAAAGAISELRAVLPSIAVVATSRVPLGLRDEHVLPLGPLGVPPPGVADADAPAVRLFLDVAERAGASLVTDDLGDVCELCRRVDGIPLAIEITATRTRSSSAGEILAALGDRLDTIDRGGFRRDARQRSVRDTVEWSYGLLRPDEQRLFDRLGAVVGSFSAATAQAVADHPATAASIDHLDALVAASLVVATRGPDRTTWYRQLETVRACARDHLADAGELVEATERFVDHTVSQAQGLAEHAFGEGWTAETFQLISVLPDALLHALRWTVEHDETPTRAFDLVTVLWGHQSRTEEVLAAAERVLARWPDPAHPRWADVAAVVATCLWITGRLDEAGELVERALPAARDAVFAPVLLRRVRGQVHRMRGRFDEAEEIFAATAREARRRGLHALVLDAELLRAAALAASGRTDAALSVARAMREEVGSPIADVMALSVESDAVLDRDPVEAVALARRGAELADGMWYAAATLGYHRTIALGLIAQGELGAAAETVRAGLDHVVEHATMPAAGTLIEAAAVLAHRAGDDRWRPLARAARSRSAAHLLVPRSSTLPSLPADDEPPDLSAALALVRGLVDDLAPRGAPAATVDAPDPLRSPESATAAVIAPPDTGSPASRAPTQVWARRGDHWEVSFDHTTVVARDSKGMGDLAVLLRTPDVEVAAIDLMGAAVTSEDTGAVIDAEARRHYENRIRELQSDLEEAEASNDIGRAERLSVELDTLVDHLTAAVGIGHRTRRPGSTRERARTAVTRRIRAAIAHLAEIHPSLGRHLDVSIRTGTYCAYRPDQRLSWRVTT